MGKKIVLFLFAALLFTDTWWPTSGAAPVSAGAFDYIYFITLRVAASAGLMPLAYTDPIIALSEGGAVAVKTDDAALACGGFIEWLRNAVQRSLIADNRWRMIVNGLGTTMLIAAFAQLFGTVLGCFVCWLMMRKNRLIRGIGRLYCGLISGLPAVVLLLITYYILFGGTQISNITTAIAAFTLIAGAGVAGIIKGAIETVDHVEIEAARSIGFSAFRAFISVTLPQAVKRALPPYTKGFVDLIVIVVCVQVFRLMVK